MYLVSAYSLFNLMIIMIFIYLKGKGRPSDTAFIIAVVSAVISEVCLQVALIKYFGIS